MSFQPREWQKQCFARFLEKLKQEEDNAFVFEACMGAGKSMMAAWMAKTLIDDYGVDHVLALVPWRSIQGDVDKGMLGTFGQMGLDARSRFFTAQRRQPRQPRPDLDATVTLYHEVCCPQALEVIRMWMGEGFTFALICDEIHHTNEINSSWGTYVEQLKELANFSIFMSGTYFRSDKKPISCIPLDTEGIPIKDYRYPYEAGVRENAVRAVTTRDLNAKIRLYSGLTEKEYDVDLNRISSYAELSAAKKQVLDPNGECIREMIQTVHQALGQTRSKFPDAACLFVCRPGGSDDFTEEGAESQEDRHVQIIAQQIQQLTGETPTVVTHHDSDSAGKIARFRRGTDPYLVAVNMVSEGCDIPRLRAVAFCRYTNSEMLFRQIVGRALRLHTPEDGTAAQIYIAAFPLLVEFAQRLYSEAQEGIKNRRCKICGEWPCICPCPVCGQHPCVCPRPPGPDRPTITAIDATPILDGGHLGANHVAEQYVSFARRLAENHVAMCHSNHTQLGYALQEFAQMRTTQANQPAAAEMSPTADRERLRRQINRRIRQLAFTIYGKDFANAYYQEIQRPFGEQFTVIMNTWGVDKLRKVADRLEQRMMETLRHA